MYGRLINSKKIPSSLVLLKCSWLGTMQLQGEQRLYACLVVKMGNDIDTWRAKIGGHVHRMGFKQISKIDGYNGDMTWTRSEEMAYRVISTLALLGVLLSSSTCLVQIASRYRNVCIFPHFNLMGLSSFGDSTLPNVFHSTDFVEWNRTNVGVCAWFELGAMFTDSTDGPIDLCRRNTVCVHLGRQQCQLDPLLP